MPVGVRSGKDNIAGLHAAARAAFASAAGDLREIVAVEVCLEEVLKARGVGFKNNGVA